MIVLARNDAAAKAPGTWQRVDAAARSVWKARICCPGCGFDCTLRGTHDVAADGTVSPSLIGPAEGCGFHDFIRLDGWP